MLNNSINNNSFDNLHYGQIILRNFGGQIPTGKDDLEKFEMIDHYKKPVLMFIFEGTEQMIDELDSFLSQSQYPYTISIDRDEDLRFLKDEGYFEASVYISKFSNLIKFIKDNEKRIADDLWGLLYGYDLEDVHEFTYNWAEWRIMKHLEFEANGGKYMTLDEVLNTGS